MAPTKIPKAQIAHDLGVPQLFVYRALKSGNGKAARTGQALSRSDADDTPDAAP